MTESQFELFTMHSGMMMEGLKSEEALAFILRAELASEEDIAWLVTNREFSRAARAAEEQLNG